MSRGKLSDNLLTFVPLLYKKLSRGIPAFEVSRQQLELLYIIHCEDGKPMRYYGEKLMVSKSNLTVMADKLIEEGLIERSFDPEDRRVIILKLTEKGNEYLVKHMNSVKEIIITRLDAFNDEDVQRLNDIFEEMKAIFSKLQ